MAVRTTRIAKSPIYILATVLTFALLMHAFFAHSAVPLRPAPTPEPALRARGRFTMFPRMLGLTLLPDAVHLAHAPMPATNAAHQPLSRHVSRINAQERRILQAPSPNIRLGSTITPPPPLRFLPGALADHPHGSLADLVSTFRAVASRTSDVLPGTPRKPALAKKVKVKTSSRMKLNT